MGKQRSMADYYTTLELTPNATARDIHQAYRKLAKRYHPDVNRSPEAHEKFIAVTEAYEALMDKVSNQAQGTVTVEENREAYEDFLRKVRERAQQQAKMRYDEFVRRNEAFQQSGINDFVLILKIVGRVLVLPIAAAFFVGPIVLAFTYGYFFLFLVLFLWPMGVFTVWSIYDNRHHYFMPGTFYYNFNRLRDLFVQTHPASESCYYCKGRIANSKVFRLELFHLKDVKLKAEGFRMNRANYINDSAIIQIPRSQKAFIVHSLVSVIKILAVLVCVFTPFIDSWVWRFVIGLTLGGLFGFLMLKITRTRSNVSYLYTVSLLIRVAVWITILRFNSTITWEPFNIYSSPFMKLAVSIILLFDCFLMQLIELIIPRSSYLSVLKQHPVIEEKTHHGYRAFNEIPLLSVVYPIFRWVWG